MRAILHPLVLPLLNLQPTRKPQRQSSHQHIYSARKTQKAAVNSELEIRVSNAVTCRVHI
jgi:hypothetical protein